MTLTTAEILSKLGTAAKLIAEISNATGIGIKELISENSILFNLANKNAVYTEKTEPKYEYKEGQQLMAFSKSYCNSPADRDVILISKIWNDGRWEKWNAKLISGNVIEVYLPVFWH